MMRIQASNFDLKQIADSGQCFRMKMSGENKAYVIAGGRFLEINDAGGGSFDFSCSEEEFYAFWHDYFDLGSDYGSFMEAADPEDTFLSKAVAFGQGIRILKQEPFETLISFIISQRKNIPAIQSSVEKLCRLCGERIGNDIYAFPTPRAVASLSEKELSECSLGYRAPYVSDAAKQIALGEKDLEAFREISDEELFDELISFRGVGRKVANCVMLFAYHRIGAFPVDVWIKRIEDEYYDGAFPTDRYKGFAGVMQQYIFYYIRNV